MSTPLVPSLRGHTGVSGSRDTLVVRPEDPSVAGGASQMSTLPTRPRPQVVLGVSSESLTVTPTPTRSPSKTVQTDGNPDEYTEREGVGGVTADGSGGWRSRVVAEGTRG